MWLGPHRGPHAARDRSLVTNDQTRPRSKRAKMFDRHPPPSRRSSEAHPLGQQQPVGRSANATFVSRAAGAMKLARLCRRAAAAAKSFTPLVADTPHEHGCAPALRGFCCCRRTPANHLRGSYKLVDALRQLSKRPFSQLVVQPLKPYYYTLVTMCQYPLHLSQNLGI